MRRERVIASLDVTVDDGDHAIALIDRQRRSIECRGRNERQGTDRHRRRYAEHADDGEAGVLGEHADAEPGIEGERTEPGGPTPSPQGFPMLRHPAECRERAPPRLGGVEAELADETLRFHGDMELELRVDPLFRRATGEEQPGPCDHSLQPAQDSLP